MTCGLGLGILLICLVQAGLGGCSWVKVTQYSNTHAGIPLPEGRLGDFGSYLQDQARQGVISPRSFQSSSFKADPAGKRGDGQSLSTSSFTHALSQPVQSSGRLVKTSMSKSNSQVTGSSASLFGPVAPGPRRSVRMQTYAQAPARRVSPGRTKGAKARSLSSQTAVGKSYLSPELALNVGGYRPRSPLAVPRSNRVRESAPGFAPVTVYKLPEPFGGSAIRRLTEPTEQGKVPVQKQQVSTTPQWVTPNNPHLTSVNAGSDWTRKKQNQGSVQKLQQILTPPPWKGPAYNPDLPSVHPASKWTKVKAPYRL
ncbi:uncharacterized protein LOC110369230 [Fundulus heteroclitus]|uniref:uncharacterized protein LOC110369230 n=1 Tax=Fundulus heteroclitus TaxID=8078 RepID=UPI00165A62D2|nr:uncharacterized protein LOC110369230 [Fundulus heteroclitus]